MHMIKSLSSPPLLLALFSLWLPSLFVNAVTPTTSAICNERYGWMNNSQPVPQSPCLVAAYLQGNCGTGFWNVPALPVGQTYNGPNLNQTNICSCSTVTYNALSACDACQDESWITWPNWKLNCDASLVTVGTYVLGLPPDTAVPQWLYQDPTQQIGNSFNLTLAQTQAGLDLPDITAANQASTVPSKPSSKKVPIGAIVGGVVGGLAFLVLMGFLIWYCIQKRVRSRASSAPSKQYINKWSKNVLNGAPPSRWGMTSMGGSVLGDPVKEDDGMVQNMPYTYPNGAMASQSPPMSTAYRRSHEQTPPPSSPPSFGFAPSAAPTSGRASHGHQSRPSRSKGFGSSPPHPNSITPFILPPMMGSPPPDHPMSADHSSASGRTGAGTPFSATEQASSTAFSPLAQSELLPSRIEYLGDRRPPAAPSSAAAVVDTSANVSRSSFGNSTRPGYYNPDDPSTYPLGEFYPAPSRRPSFEGTALGSSTFMHSPQEKRGGIVHNQNPSQHPSPIGPGQNNNFGRNPAPLNMNMSLAGSVHTLPYSASPATPANALAAPMAAPRLDAVQGSPPNSGGGILSAWGRRGRRGSGSDGAGAAVLTTSAGPVAPNAQWTPHVPDAEAEREFDPWKRS